MSESTAQKVKVEVIAGVVLAGVLAVIAAIWAYMPTAWAWLKSTLSTIGAYFASPATVPTWLMWLLATCAAWVTFKILAFVVRRSLPPAPPTSSADPSKPREPTQRDYAEDHFFGAVWRWEYSSAMDRILNLTPYCPNCDTALVWANRDLWETKTSVYCETCQHMSAPQDGDKQYFRGMVERQIDRKIRNGEWKNYVELKA